jgi:uncharacterized membrane protein YoaK (UPF0700 family)
VAVPLTASSSVNCALIRSGSRSRNIRDLSVSNLALGLQNGAFRRVGGISVHTTYLTGMITSLISTEAEQYSSEEVPHDVRAYDPKIELLCGIWIAFVLGAGTGAAMSFHFHALGILGAALFLIPLALREVRS